MSQLDDRDYIVEIESWEISKYQYSNKDLIDVEITDGLKVENYTQAEAVEIVMAGPQGLKGDTGEQGPQGVQGPPGEPAVHEGPEPPTDTNYLWVDPTDVQLANGELRGTGFPEGVVTAPVGTYYTDTAATNGAIRWVKASGSGNSGWKVVYGDTGWRILGTDLMSGWEYRGHPGRCHLRRINDTVYFELGLYRSEAFSGWSSQIVVLNYGFRPASYIRRGVAKVGNTGIAFITNQSSIARIDLDAPASLTGFGADTYISGTGTWFTDQDWPSVLQGSAG